MIDTLIVPLDGCEETLPAFHVAEALALGLGASVTAVVVDDPEMGGFEAGVWLKDHAASDAVPVERVVKLSDDVVGTLLSMAEAPGATLCLSSHGRTAVGAGMLGSMSAEIVRRSLKDVLLVGPHARAPFALRTVQICVDGETADSVVATGGLWAERLGVMPLVVTAVDNDGSFLKRDRPRERVAEAEELLRNMGLAPRTSVLCQDDLAGALLHHAETHGAGLIVAGEHRPLGMEGFFYGSISRALVHRSSVPVLLVQPENPAAR